MGQAKINRKLREERAKTPEGAAAQAALESQQDTSWASQMAPRLLQEKRGMSGVLVARFARQWLERSLDELKEVVADQRDLALAIAYSRASIEAHRVAMTLVAFEADFKAGGVDRLVASVEKELPIKLYTSNNAEKLKAERLARATRIAHEAYRLALVEVLAELSLLDSLANPRPPVTEEAPTKPRVLGEVEGVEPAPDFNAPMELRDVEEVHEIGCDMGEGEDCSCGKSDADVAP